MLKIYIPKPCHEDWNKMTPDKTGRHCSSCAKSVVDFTGMSDEEVKHFFINKKEERVCGRFKQTQLQRIVIELPQNIFSIQMPLWKKFLAVCLVVFSTTLFSCETKIKDKVVTNTQTEDAKARPFSDHVYLGGISMMYDSVPGAVNTCGTTVGYSVPEFVTDTSIIELKGDVEFTRVVQADTVPVPPKANELIIVGDTIYEELPLKKLQVNTPDTAAKTKNPLKADSINCNTIKNYY